VDYTDRVVANQQLEAVNQNLEDLVNDRTRELIIAKDQALAASQSKADFLANMSHEIRTPLNAIIGLAHVALTNNPETRQKVYLEKIRGSGEHLLEIINDILSFSRMEAGKLELDHSEFFIDQLIDKTLDLVWEKAAAKKLEVKVVIDPRIPKVLVGDALRLGQILINFCANAVKFTDKGFVSISVTQVRDWEKKVELLFEVKDTGIGIAPEKIEQLFQPFQQVDASSARRFEGTGLGLSICKNLAELMGGKIDVKSVLGQGSNFRLRVQLEKSLESTDVPIAFAAAPLIHTQPQNYAPLNCFILVVEDNPLNQEIILSLLDAMGAQARCVDSGLAAIAAVQQDNFDLVLMDIQLPGMDGVEATARIRQLDKGKRLPIIAVTANALPGDKESYLAAGMDGYISKPVDPAELYQLLDQWGHSCRLADTVVPPVSRFEFLFNGGIDTERALHHLMNNEALYKRLLERFARERAEFPTQLEDWLVNDLPTALNQVHSLKSLAGSLGMLQLESIALHLEEQLRAGAPEAQQVEKLNTELLAMVELVNLGLDLKD
jgi:two-component system, sensor histidine kinase and response regulator